MRNIFCQKVQRNKNTSLVFKFSNVLLIGQGFFHKRQRKPQDRQTSEAIRSFDFERAMCFDEMSELSQRAELRESIPTSFLCRKLLTQNLHLLPFSDVVAKQAFLHSGPMDLGYEIHHLTTIYFSSKLLKLPKKKNTSGTEAQ